MKSTKISKELADDFNQTDNQHLIVLRKNSYLLHHFWNDLKKIIRVSFIQYKRGKISFQLSYQKRNKWDKAWLISQINKYRQDRKYEQHLCQKLPLLVNQQIVCIDEQIIKPIYVLNKLGYTTMFCCQGHIKEKYGNSTYIVLEYPQTFPVSLIKQLNASHYRLSPIKKGKFRKGQAIHAAPSASSFYTNKELLDSLNRWANEQMDLSQMNWQKSWKIFD